MLHLARLTMHQWLLAKVVLCALTIFVSASQCRASEGDRTEQSADLDDSDAQYLKFKAQALEHAKALYEACPPSQCFILNFGVSVALTSAYFRAMIPDPAERRKYYAELMVQSIPRYRQREKDVIFQLFDAVIPSPADLGGRPVVVHRIVYTGSSMDRLYEYLDDYKRERRPDLKFGIYALFDTSYYKDFRIHLLPRDLNPRFLILNTEYVSDYLNIFDSHRKTLAQYAETRSAYYSDIAKNSSLFGRSNLVRKELDDVACIPLSRPAMTVP